MNVNMENSTIADLNRVFGAIVGQDYSLNPTLEMIEAFDENGSTLGYPHFFGAPFDAADATNGVVQDESEPAISEDKAQQMLDAFAETDRLISEQTWIQNSPYFGQNYDLNVWKEAVNAIKEKKNDFVPADFVPIEVQ